MTTSNGSSQESRLYLIAEDYEQRGYKVTVAPPAKRLPKFLSNFSPDIVAKGPNESVVIEVTSPGRLRGAEYWEQLYSAVREHPGWRVDLVVDNRGNQQRAKSISRGEIENRLQEGQRLAEQRMLAASLLITWAAAEAAMRSAGKRHGVEFPDLRPETLITRLYSDGLLDRKDFEFLLDCTRARSAVAHGFLEGRLKLSMLNRLQRLTRRLLQ